MNIQEQLLSALGSGQAERYVGSDPAANTEFSYEVPTGLKLRLLAVRVVLAQGATQTPLPTLLIKDEDANEVYAAPGATSAQNASVTCTYVWANGLTAAAGGAATRNYGQLPSGLVIPEGWTIESSTSGIGANSNYGAPAILAVPVG